MRILFDATALALASYHKGGAYRYGIELLRHLPPVLPEGWELRLYFNFVRGAHRRKMEETVRTVGGPSRTLCRVPPRLLELLRVPAEWTGGAHDLFHGPFDRLPRTSRSARVVTIHDLAFLRAPEGLPRDWIEQLQAVVPRAARRAHRILTVSEFSRRDIVERLGVPAERVEAIHHGIPAGHAPPADPAADRARLAERYGIRDDYVLYLGTLQPNKNVEGLCAAFQILRRGGFEGSLVLAGAEGWLFDEMWARIASRGEDRGVIRTGFVDEEDVPRLYGNCRVFALVSFLEGFGIPAIEAMACGAPVVAAAACSLPEVCGEAAILVDPHSAEAIAAGLEAAAGPRREELVRAGLERAAGFTWESSARQHVAAYRRALEDR